ncbi:hypothetical protein JCM10021v2_005081 [Rhodotorula toruloides]
MSIMPRPVDIHDSVRLLSSIQQCFRDIREAAAYSNEGVIQGRSADNGGLLGRVDGVLHILDSRLRLVWHQLALVDEESGNRRTFQQEIWSEVVHWQSGENRLDRAEIDFVFGRIKELIVETTLIAPVSALPLTTTHSKGARKRTTGTT